MHGSVVAGRSSRTSVYALRFREKAKRTMTTMCDGSGTVRERVRKRDGARNLGHAHGERSFVCFCRSAPIRWRRGVPSFTGLYGSPQHLHRRACFLPSTHRFSWVESIDAVVNLVGVGYNFFSRVSNMLGLPLLVVQRVSDRRTRLRERARTSANDQKMHTHVSLSGFLPFSLAGSLNGQFRVFSWGQGPCLSECD